MYAKQQMKFILNMMKLIKDSRIDFYGDNFFIVGFQVPVNYGYIQEYEDMKVKRISETTTKVFCTPGISLN